MILEVPDHSLLLNTFAVAVDGSRAMAFGGGLHAGAIVTAWNGNHQIAERIFVLNVRHIDTSSDADVLTRYVIVLAVPADLLKRNH